MNVRVAVFASGGGTTFQALLDHERASDSPLWTVALVVSDRADAGAMERAAAAAVPAVVVTDRGREPSDVAAETLRVLDDHAVRAICLAGYLRLVPEEVVTAFAGRILNVHPALLPSFGGKGMYGDRVHRAVLESGARVSGPTVHMVDAEYDRGTPLAQWPIPVLSDDTTEVLRGRVQTAERGLYPLVMDHVAQAIMRGDPPSPLSLRSGAFAAADRVSPQQVPSDAAMGGIMKHAFHEDENRDQHE